MDLKRFQEPFSSGDIEWRVNRSGVKNGKPWAKVLAYVTNRAIMDRLDNVAGPENWQNSFTPGPSGGVMCGISILSGDQWVTKYDGSENTEFESIKGGYSGSMKRAAVHWGIGRYLYGLEEGWADFVPNGTHSDKIDGVFHKWNPPTLPNWALPVDEKGADVESIHDGPFVDDDVDVVDDQGFEEAMGDPDGGEGVNSVMRRIDASGLSMGEKTKLKEEAMKKPEDVLGAWVMGYLNHKLKESNVKEFPKGKQEEIF